MFIEYLNRRGFFKKVGAVVGAAASAVLTRTERAGLHVEYRPVQTVWIRKGEVIRIEPLVLPEHVRLVPLTED